jgi:hypothetical protein
MGESVGETQHEAEGSRVQRVLDSLRRRSDRPLGRLALRFRAYFAASRNTGYAISIYASFSVRSRSRLTLLSPSTAARRRIQR